MALKVTSERRVPASLGQKRGKASFLFSPHLQLHPRVFLSGLLFSWYAILVHVYGLRTTTTCIVSAEQQTAWLGSPCCCTLSCLSLSFPLRWSRTSRAHSIFALAHAFQICNYSSKRYATRDAGAHAERGEGCPRLYQFPRHSQLHGTVGWRFNHLIAGGLCSSHSSRLTSCSFTRSK